MCHIFRILIVKFAAIARCSYHENRDDWGGTLSSVCGIVNGNVSKAETISVTAQIHREDLWLVGWSAEGFALEGIIALEVIYQMSLTQSVILHLNLERGELQLRLLCFGKQKQHRPSKICPVKRSS